MGRSDGGVGLGRSLRRPRQRLQGKGGVPCGRAGTGVTHAVRLVLPAPGLQPGDACLDLGRPRVVGPQGQRVQDAIDRRQSLKVRGALRGVDALKAAIERPAAQRSGTGQTSPERSQRCHRVVSQPKSPPGRHIQIAGGDEVARLRTGYGERGQLMPQRSADAAEVSLHADTRQIRHSQIDGSRMAIEPVGRDRHPARQQEQLGRAYRHPAAIVQPEQRQPESAPGGQRAEALGVAGQPGGRIAEQRPVRRRTQQARRDIHQRGDEQVGMRFRVQSPASVGPARPGKMPEDELGALRRDRAAHDRVRKDDLRRDDGTPDDFAFPASGRVLVRHQPRRAELGGRDPGPARPGLVHPPPSDWIIPGLVHPRTGGRTGSCAYRDSHASTSSHASTYGHPLRRHAGRPRSAAPA